MYRKIILPRYTMGSLSRSWVMENVMKKFAGILILTLFHSSLSYADVSQASVAQKLALDDVNFQLMAREWVSTQSAVVQVNINATLSNTDMVKSRDEIVANLAKIAAGEWHITQFDRTQDSSGLEKLNVLAEARILQTNLANIYTNSKSVSRPGANFSVVSVEFKPSLEELQLAKNKLRERLYQQVQDEVGRLNKVYTEQHYSVHHLFFIEGDLPMPLEYARKASANIMLAATSPAAPLVLSNELKLSVMVTLSSNRQGAH